MTDDDKCLLIAEFEFSNLSGTIIVPDYSKDLNATMRAAQRLAANGIRLDVSSTGHCIVVNFLPDPVPEKGGEVEILAKHCGGDPARAAFEALAAYLENSQRER